MRIYFLNLTVKKMGKHKEQYNESLFDDNVLMGELNGVEYALDDSEFFEQFEPKKTRQKAKGARDARRRIEQYLEDRKLTESLTEYYDDLND